MNNTPEILYKYVDLIGAEKILFENTFKVTPPNEFNDPFELLGAGFHNLSDEFIVGKLLGYDTYKVLKKSGQFNMSYPDYVNEISRNKGIIDGVRVGITDPKFNHEGFKRMVDELSSIIGVVCFSGNYNSILMWSHYAEQHGGVVIGFDSHMLGDKWIKVRYEKERALINAERYREYEEIEKLVETKYIDWSYEDEYRYLYYLDKCKKSPYGDSGGVCLIPFKEEVVKVVIFGCKIDNKAYYRIGERVKDIYGNRVVMKKAFMDFNKYGIFTNVVRF